MATNQALIRSSDIPGNGNGVAVSSDVPRKNLAEVPALTDEVVKEILAGHGLRGWLRAARVARVLGLFSLYLFLDTYDIRAGFNRRMEARKRDAISQDQWPARLQAWTR